MGPTLTRTTPTRTPTARTLRALARAVEPVEPDRFLEDYWERRPLLVPRSEDGRFDDLLSQGEAERLVSSTGLRYPAVRVVKEGEKIPVSSYTETVSWRPTGFTATANVERIAAEFERGATVVIQALHLYHLPVAEFCRALEADLAATVQANAYYTPRSAQGLPVHHDTHDVFCLQIAGEKRWLVYEPRLELPLPDQRYSEELGEPGEPVLDVTLTPGDTLYLPRGWLHEALTSDADSLHITVGIKVYTGSTRCAQRSRRRRERRTATGGALPTAKSCRSSCWGCCGSGLAARQSHAGAARSSCPRAGRSAQTASINCAGCASSTPRRRSNDVTASCSTSRPAIRKSHSRSKGGESRFPRTHARSSRRLRARRSQFRPPTAWEARRGRPARARSAARPRRFSARQPRRVVAT